MGLIFDIDKDKSIAMMVETSGIEDTSRLDFTFNILVDGIKYGFPCELNEGKVKICIPALKEVIKGLKTGDYKASLDVTGDKNYFLQPFSEDVKLTQEPKVDVIVDKEDKVDMAEAITATVSKILDITEETDIVDESITDDSINTTDKEDKDSSDDKKSIVNKMFN